MVPVKIAVSLLYKLKQVAVIKLQISVNTEFHPVNNTANCGLLNIRSPDNKCFICQEFIFSNRLDFLILTNCARKWQILSSVWVP